jgi:hypothetical protein
MTVVLLPCMKLRLCCRAEKSALQAIGQAAPLECFPGELHHAGAGITQAARFLTLMPPNPIHGCLKVRHGLRAVAGVTDGGAVRRGAHTGPSVLSDKYATFERRSTPAHSVSLDRCRDPASSLSTLARRISMIRLALAPCGPGASTLSMNTLICRTGHYQDFL